MASLFWDNSNIWLVGRNAVCKKRERADMNHFRIHFANLFNYVLQGRKIDYAYVAGSVPPQTDALWKRFRALNIKVETQVRGATGGEIAVDEAIQLAMANRLLDGLAVAKPEQFILLTGDGAGYTKGKGFITCLERAVKHKFPIEVVSWDAGVNPHLKKFAQANGNYISLEPGYDKITFINNKRWALPV
jgi:hypothetical protein